MGWKSLMAKAVLGATLVAAPAATYASVFISVGIAPPVLPVYTQPICPGEGYLWTPGYWAYGEDGYFWVPGVWVQPPQVGSLWTPGYWGWGGGAYLWHTGYWGPHIGFYGGVNYGFGYGGAGYEGGYWNNNRFFYNRTVNNINVTNIHNTYNRTVVVNNVSYNRVSYNGGSGGLQARPSAQEQAAVRDRHMEATGNQLQHETAARGDRQQFASVNGGRPPVAAQARVGDRGNVVPARNANVNGREFNQQQRIANGVSNGDLTAREASRAENRQAAINGQVRADRQANGGTLTPGQRGQVNREQNGASRQIYRENNNGRVNGNTVRENNNAARQPSAQPGQGAARPQAQPESRPAPQAQSRQMESRPAPQARPEGRPAGGGGGGEPRGGGGPHSFHR